MSEILNFDDTTPAADSGYTLIKWKKNTTPDGVDPTTGYSYFDLSGELPNVGTAVVKTANYTATRGDMGMLLVFNSASAVTLTLPSSIPLNTLSTPTTETRWKIAVQNVGAGVLTIARNGLLIDTAAANLTLNQNSGVEIFTDGTNYFSERGSASGVTSVALTVPSRQSVSGSPVTGAGTFVITDNNQSANTFFRGPTSGSPGATTFGLIVPADLPVGSSSQIGGLQVDGSTITATAGVISSAAGTPNGLIQLLQSRGNSGVFSSANKAGSCIVVEFSDSTGTSATCADTNGNTYTLYNQQTPGGGLYGVFVALNVRAGANTVTVTGSTIRGIYEYSNVASVDANVSASTTSAASLGTGTATTTTPNDRIHLTAMWFSANPGSASNASGWQSMLAFGASFNTGLGSFATTQLTQGALSNTVTLSGTGGVSQIYAGLICLSPWSISELAAKAITAIPLPIAQGGTGTTSPGLVAGTNVTISGTWPNQNISASGGGGGGGFTPYPTSLSPPVVSSFSWVNQGTATATTKSNRMVVTMPDPNPSVIGRFLVATASLPATPYTVDVGGMISQTSSGNGAILAAGVFDGSNNSVAFGLFTNSTAPLLNRAKWTSAGAISLQTTKTINAHGEALFFIRITDDGTTRSFYSSPNGLDYFLYGTEAHNTDVTPTHAGLQFYNNGGGAGAVAVISVFHFLVSSSILPQFAP